MCPRLASRELVLVAPNEAERCLRTFEQLERLQRGVPLRRSREGIRAPHAAPPISRKALGAVRRALHAIATGELPPSATGQIAVVIARHRLALMRRDEFERCERLRLDLKNALRRRREAGILVEAEREPSRFHTLARGAERCRECTAPATPGARTCTACRQRNQRRRRVPEHARKVPRWRW